MAMHLKHRNEAAAPPLRDRGRAKLQDAVFRPFVFRLITPRRDADF
jgi:hypothetical protein